MAAADYPAKTWRFHRFVPGQLTDRYELPKGELHQWPPIQVRYLDSYVATLNCKTIVEETHYVDRDYIADLALFYGKSLRNYPNYCRRLHFFDSIITKKKWRQFIAAARNDINEIGAALSEHYLGFSVVRPLPGHPIGRTVIKTLGPEASDGVRHFEPIRPYVVNLGGLQLNLRGLAFQQQDQGVSACATTAVWTALHSTAHTEQFRLPAPADITLAASRYLMMNGRTLPSEGLAIQQVCEAIRDAGLAPVLVRSTSPAVDRGVLDTYLRSGFPTVLAVMPEQARQGDAGHAICAVGAKLANVQPQTNPAQSYQDGSSALKAVYVHDDRLGPYAVATLSAVTSAPDGALRSSLIIKWPLQKFDEESVLLHSIVIPMPVKVRLPVTRLRYLGHLAAQSLGTALPQFNGQLTMTCKYILATTYVRQIVQSQVTAIGIEQLSTGLALSRYVGLVEISAQKRPFVDVLLDSTEAVESPSVVATVLREAQPAATTAIVRKFSGILGAPFIS
jgi:hypothetical protein